MGMIQELGFTNYFFAQINVHVELHGEPCDV